MPAVAVRIRDGHMQLRMKAMLSLLLVATLGQLGTPACARQLLQQATTTASASATAVAASYVYGNLTSGTVDVNAASSAAAAAAAGDNTNSAAVQSLAQAWISVVSNGEMCAICNLQQ